jgi:para-nitrobenzyl esterase
MLRKFLIKFLRGDAMRFYNNEIKGVGAIDWKRFPKALVISEKEFRCEPIEDKLTEVKSLLLFIRNYY